MSGRGGTTAVRVIWVEELDQRATGPLWATVRYAGQGTGQPEVLVALSATAPHGQRRRRAAWRGEENQETRRTRGAGQATTRGHAPNDTME